MYKTLISLFTFCFLALSINAQAPTVVSVFPNNMENAAEKDVRIKVVFDQPIDQTIVDYTQFRIFGRWSGPSAFAFTVSDDKKEIEMIPEDDYFSGEWVTVMLSKGIKSESGEFMETGYSWNFWIKTAPGDLTQEMTKTIQLREPGEGWLQTYGAYAGDLNNDGFSDLTTVNENSDDLRIFLNDGTGDYTEGEHIYYDMGSSTPSPNEGADFNGDGEIDLAVCTAHDNSMRVLMGNGDGNFYSMDNYSTGDAARGLGVTDIEGDGDDDIIIANRVSSNLSIYTNDGSGNFVETNINPDGSGESGLSIADANNDGIHDLFIGMYSSNEIAIMLGDGNGNYTMSDKKSVTGSPWMIAVGDVNNDGFADVVSANSNGSNSVCLFGDGQGGLSFPTNYFGTGAGFPLAIDLGDLDGDGDLDMVTTNYSSAKYQIFENTGQGAFEWHNNLVSPQNASCAILHDRDNDGDLDISGTDESVDVLILFTNPGATVANTEIEKLNIDISISPNPLIDFTNISLTLEEKSDLSISIKDISGKTIKTIYSEKNVNGAVTVTWNGQDEKGLQIPSGTYLISFVLNGKSYAEKISKL